MKKTLFEIVGWYGVVAIFSAYLLVSFSIVEPETYLYQILNLTGGIGIVLASVIKKAYQPAALNVIWSVIASIAIIRLLV